MTELINLKPERTYAKQPVLICEMCAIYAVNRDTTAMEPDEEQRIVSAHSEISSRGWIIEPVDPYEIHFSYARCDTCSSSLGGNRMDAYLVSMHPGESALEEALMIERDGSSAYTVEELLQLMISDIKAIRPEIEIPAPTDDLEELIWDAEIVQSRAYDLGLYVIEDDGYWIYDLRLIPEAAAESFALMEEER